MRASGASRPEAQARRLVAAYPWRVREERGAEIVGTVLDTLPPDAGHLPLATAVDLVRGGLRTRRQRRPPFRTRLAHDFGLTIHPRWIWWVFDRVEHPRYRRHDVLRRIGSMVVAFGVIAVLQRNLALFLLAGALATLSAVVAARLFGEPQRNGIRRRYGLVAGGSNPDVVWVQTVRRSWWPGRRSRVSVRPVHRSALHFVPGAEAWTPEREEAARAAERPSGPAS